MPNKMCLKWKHHITTFNKHLDKLFLNEKYSDSTILCGGEIYPVHQMVLTSCSKYFETVFDQCLKLNKHPFIVIKDVDSKYMEAILNYMYKGEVNVPQDDLDELLEVADSFKIQGLSVEEKRKRPENLQDEIDEVVEIEE